MNSKTVMAAPDAMYEVSPFRIAVKNLRFGFGGTPKKRTVTVFNDLSLNLGDENPVAILGPSGCGKTTLLRLLAGLLTPDSVETPRSTTVAVFPLPGAFVFQEHRLLPWLSVLDNVTLPLKRLMDTTRAKSRALNFLDMVSLSDKAAAYPEELSGGQKQRASLARAFAYPAPVIYLDEPFQSLDIPLRLELLEITRSLIEKENRLTVVVTHDPREAAYLGRRIIVLGKDATGIVFDENVDLSPEDRAFGTEAQSRLEAQLLLALKT
jgi:NitT/TauT family transport system ATP-binding protein